MNRKNLLGMNKYLLGIFIAIIIAIIVTVIVIVISVKESKKKKIKKKKVKFVVYMSVNQITHRCLWRLRQQRNKAYGRYEQLHKPLQKLKKWARYKKWVKITELNCDMSEDSDQCTVPERRNSWPEILYFVDGEKKGTRYEGELTFRKMKEFIEDIAKS